MLKLSDNNKTLYVEELSTEEICLRALGYYTNIGAQFINGRGNCFVNLQLVCMDTKQACATIDFEDGGFCGSEYSLDKAYNKQFDELQSKWRQNCIEKMSGLYW